jgi:hypothetical protein
MSYETYTYSICEDCLLYWAQDEVPEGAGDDYRAERDGDLARELNGREGHLSLGVEPTDEDPDGDGYEEFSHQECELCRSGLGGSRHGCTLFVKVDSE